MDEESKLRSSHNVEQIVAMPPASGEKSNIEFKVNVIDESDRKSFLKKSKSRDLSSDGPEKKSPKLKIRNLKTRSSSSNDLPIISLPRTKERKKRYDSLDFSGTSLSQLEDKKRNSPRKKLVVKGETETMDIQNPVLTTRLKKLDRSSSMMVNQREKSPKLIQSEDDDIKRLKNKKNSLDSNHFPKISREMKKIRTKVRSKSEPYINSWEYGNMYADFYVEERKGYINDIILKNFNKKGKRPKKKKTFSNEESEIVFNKLVELDKKFQSLSIGETDVIYDTINEKEVIVVAGTKDKLFSLLADHRVQDKDYIDIFLATHLRFMSTEELLDQLLNRYSNPISSEMKIKLKPAETDQFQFLLKLRIVNVFKKWLKYRYAYEFEDEAISSKIEQWIKSVSHDKNKDLHLFLQSAWEARLKTNFDAYEMDDNEAPKSITPKKTSPEDLSFLDLDPVELARQITLLNQKMFQNIRNHHLLLFLDGDNTHSNPVHEISQYSKTITAWVTTEIVTTPQTKKRIFVLSNFIRLCHALVGMNNYHAALDIYIGISHFLVARMKKTRKGVTGSTKDKWKALDELFKPDKGWSNLRKNIKDSTTPIIIPPAIWLHDLIVINENDDDWGKENSNHDFINFHKLRLFTAVFQEVYKCQLEPYNFQKVEIIETFLKKHLLTLSIEDLERESKDKNESKQKDTLKVSSPGKAKLARKPSFTSMLMTKLSPKKEKN